MHVRTLARRSAATLVVACVVLCGGVLPAAASGSADVAVQGCDGVAVVVDPGILGGDPEVRCDEGPGSRSGLDALDGAGLDVEGTARWGPAFVCRIDGRPAPDESVELADGTSIVESCANTPSTQAYWSVWLSGDDGVGWVYAATGVADLVLYPGDVLGLRFGASADDGAAPASDAAPRVAPRVAPGDAAAQADTAAEADAAPGASGTLLVEDGTDTDERDLTWPVVVMLGLVGALVWASRRRRA